MFALESQQSISINTIGSTRMLETANPSERTSAITATKDMGAIEDQSETVRPETSTSASTSISTWRERFDRHETIFDEGRTFTPPDLWLRLESLEQLKAEKSKWMSERRHIANEVKKARMECREIEEKHLAGQESKENLDKHEKTVRLLEGCWVSAEDHLKYCEDCIKRQEKRAAKRMKKQEAKQKEEEARGAKQEEAKVPQEEGTSAPAEE